MKTEDILKQLHSIVNRYYNYSRSKDHSSRQTITLLTSIRAAIERLAPPDSAYLSQYTTIRRDSYDNYYEIENLMGIVESLQEDYRIGALAPLQELIRAEVFDDFLDMATHLLEALYKDPAAVIVGGVLEQHLRKLCLKSGIPIESNGKPKKADLMNSELASEAVYGKLDQKSITAWLDLRNKAAHAEYDSYSHEQVQTMLYGG